MFLLYFTIFFLISIFFTFFIKKIAIYFKIVDKPGENRKIHKKPVPLLGGVAVFLAYFLSLFIFKEDLLSGNLELSHWLGFFIGAVFIVMGGVLDDKYNLSAKWQIIWPILASIAVILGGVNIEKISNPFGGFLYFSTFLSSAIIFLWLLGMTYTTKLLDGLDGLASGVSAIGALVIFLFTISDKYYQPDIALASFLFFTVLCGFLVFNFNPAKIFLGESGSLLLGYVLGVLAIISGGKIAIALLVIGLPALDVLWTIIRRTISGKNPFKASDRKHLHHRLIDLGLSQKQAVFFFYFVSVIFGLSGLFLQSKGKFLALAFLLFLMFFLIIFLYYLENKKNKRERLLLHICCAPCGLSLISDILLKKFDIILYFYNPNIDSLEEFNRRLNYVKIMSKEFGLKLEVEPYQHGDWLRKIKGLELEPEKGKRCTICYQDRLFKTALKAKKLGINNFYSTLLVSPYKDAERIKVLANKISLEKKLKFIKLDFNQADLSKKSNKLAKEKGFYCQKYCGCEFAKK
ncbi:MAG: epoxyqueuosine reductase QueH [Patescibacteria group bacterium]|nr:epoxyqueuosine reductase QueH [Patescibacteria group bacterium]